MQDNKKCDPAGRSCIESNAHNHFNCSVACEGIFVDIQEEEEDLSAFLTETTEKLKEEGKGEMLKIRKVEKLINDYVASRKAYVQHFKYDAKETSTNFSKSFTLNSLT